MERGLVAVYIMTNGIRGTLYVGVTSDLYRRVSEHKAGVIAGFTKDHDLKHLVWFEPHERVTTAIQREKSIKRYLRDWKFNLIERDNPNWDDLSLVWNAPPVWRHGPE
ncbi:endonuclease [Brevundimonas sp. Leaf280]|uniref:GIY-YIG nuclease family protein n=1 Tax=Brevundimonas sp. Leaf280 TaxID=1736320 RepID=UPI0007002B3F|nr:GIY-YIG nuclease family protein [Brevundimonas sp. Leaf280]KQP46366.1 endonuclease [Brevundimonas sp. Leaf280]